MYLYLPQNCREHCYWSAFHGLFEPYYCPLLALSFEENFDEENVLLGYHSNHSSKNLMGYDSRIHAQFPMKDITI